MIQYTIKSTPSHSHYWMASYDHDPAASPRIRYVCSLAGPTRLHKVPQARYTDLLQKTWHCCVLGYLVYDGDAKLIHPSHCSHHADGLHLMMLVCTRTSFLELDFAFRRLRTELRRP